MNKKKKSNRIKKATRKAIIDATSKQLITIVPTEEVSIKEIEEEFKQLNETANMIRKKLYAHDVALKRVQSRTLTEMYNEYLKEIIKQFNKQRT